MGKALRTTRAKTYITRIKMPDDTLVRASLDIAQTFKSYYTGLYNLTAQSSPASQETKQGLIQQYLESSGMPSLSEDIVADLDQSITSDEFLAALKT